MNKKKVEECIYLTDKIITSYFQGDRSLFNNYLHSSVTWIGSFNHEYCMGKKAVLEGVKVKSKDIKKITIRNKEFNCILKNHNNCTIMGQYIRSTNVTIKEVFEDIQRITIIWIQEDNNLYIKHLHLSNPTIFEENKEGFPHSIGKNTKKYLDVLIQKEVQRAGKITVKDTNNVHHRIDISHIQYLESFNTNTLFHTTKGDVFARVRLIDIEKTLQHLQEGMFLRVHKSFCVNTYYINSIKRYEMEIANNYRIPISKNKYQEIIGKLYE